jgi:hypothetical protein
MSWPPAMTYERLGTGIVIAAGSWGQRNELPWRPFKHQLEQVRLRTLD